LKPTLPIRGQCPPQAGAADRQRPALLGQAECHIDQRCRRTDSTDSTVGWASAHRHQPTITSLESPVG
ncbi:hypothetical protein, partial [Stutzerimonas stutzeri]|uniref:hypothetical protein n=1 Tax=Stutzerimonas stutzeri TaxID=316 RepID=UPI0004CEF79C